MQRCTSSHRRNVPENGERLHHDLGHDPAPEETAEEGKAEWVHWAGEVVAVVAPAGTGLLLMESDVVAVVAVVVGAGCSGCFWSCFLRLFC